MKEDKILGPEVTGTSFDILDNKFLLINKGGSQFYIYKDNSILYTCELELTRTENNKAKFIFKNPFEKDVIFDCTENVIWDAIAWIADREMRNTFDEIS